MARTRAATETTKRQQPKRVPPLTVSRTFGQKSPLVDTDLQVFLARCMSTDQWQNYTDGEKGRILKSLPSSRESRFTAPISNLPESISADQTVQLDGSKISHLITEQDTPVDKLSSPPAKSSDVTTNTYIKRAIARFKRDLRDGYYEKAWQDKARRAHEERMQGKFNEYVRSSAEDMFEDDMSGENADDQDELAEVSEDGEYLDTSRKRSKVAGRPGKSSHESPTS